jgi:NAD(P)-dependent dehydrogenase (short-subunit alcohol dehydrogenase family)
VYPIPKDYPFCESPILQSESFSQNESDDLTIRKREKHTVDKKKTIIVTGASRDIGAAVLRAFLDRGYNVVANSRSTVPGVVDTPVHKDHSIEFLKNLSQTRAISEVQDVVDAVIYLTEARYVTGGVLHVDGGAHAGRW